MKPFLCVTSCLCVFVVPSEISLNQFAIILQNIFATSIMIMKKIFSAIIFIALMMACNNSDSGTKKSAEEIKADSLEKDIDQLHGSAMGRNMQLRDVQKKVEAALDSISKLPANLKSAASPYQSRLDSLLNRLKYADYAMETWMGEYKFDSFNNDVQKRMQYLESELSKIQKVKQAIVSSLQNADSVLKKE